MTATALPDKGEAACNLIPGRENNFNSTLGVTNRPYAAPGETVELEMRPCDPSSAGFTSTTEDHLVTVAFTRGFTRHLVVLATGTSCSTSLSARIAGECGTVSAACVDGAEAGLQVVDRDGVRHLRFRFPDTDAQLLEAGDEITLSGPARIAVTASAPTAPLPCNLTTTPCAGQTGLKACIDSFFVNDGACGTSEQLQDFPGFTALPPPNNYAADCFREAGPCDPTATELRVAMDSAFNLLLPVHWQGVLVREAGVPVPRLTRMRVKVPVPFHLSQVSGFSPGSYTPEGSKLPPIFEPQFDPDSLIDNGVTFFGTVDAPYTILRIARRHGTCVGGGNDDGFCTTEDDCRGGTCADSCVDDPAALCTFDGECGGGGPCGRLFDLSLVPYVLNGGPVVLERLSTDGICQVWQSCAEDSACGTGGSCVDGVCAEVGQTCADDSACGTGGLCVNYAAEAELPVPLEGLAGSEVARTFTALESIDARDRNGDGDISDSVITLRDRESGAIQPLGAPAGCGISGNPEGRAVVRISKPPFSFPAVAVEDDVIAFLESETGAKSCDVNADYDVFDPVPRIFRLGDAEIPISPARSVDGAPLIDGASIAVSNGIVFFRSSEAATAQRLTERVTLRADSTDSTATSRNPAVSNDGRYVAFTNEDALLLGWGNLGNGYFLAYVRDRISGTLERASVAWDGGLPDYNVSGLSLSPDGRYVVLVSEATNLVSGDTNDACDTWIDNNMDGVFDDNCADVFLRDRCVSDGVLVPGCTEKTELVSVAADGSQGNAGSFNARISADGRYVVFQSDATNLVPGDGNTNCDTRADGNIDGVLDDNCPDVFLRDRCVSNGVDVPACVPSTELVSLTNGGAQPSGYSGSPGVSADGRFVAFASGAPDIVADDTNTCLTCTVPGCCDDIFVRDRCVSNGETVPGCTPGTTRVSVATDDTQSDQRSLWPFITPDGRHVLFTSAGTTLAGSVPDPNLSEDVFVHDLRTGSTERVSVGPSGAVQIGGQSHGQGISDDGRYVAFRSTARQLVQGDTNTCGIFTYPGTCPDVFVHDRVTGTTERVSVSTEGSEADERSGGSSLFDVTIAGDGRSVAFVSEATNFVFRDPSSCNSGSGCPDIFVRGLDETDPLAADDLLFDDDSLDDTTLEVVDTKTLSPAVTTLCPANQVALAAGNAAFLRPESEIGTSTCPGGSLNTDTDIEDLVVQRWTGGSTPENLGRAATTVSISANICDSATNTCGGDGVTPCVTDGDCPAWIAALVDEEGDGSSYNQSAGDDDTDDTVVQVHGLNTSAGSWHNLEQAADTVKMSGSRVVFITPESAQGVSPGTNLNPGDGDTDFEDRVLQVAYAEGPAPGSTPLLTALNVGQAAEEFVVGERTEAGCGVVHLVAFRTSEAAQGANLNAASGDGDTDDAVLQLYDLESGTLHNTGRAVLPCQIPECDPRWPYRVDGEKVTFLTYEPDQNGLDLTGDGTLGLALQVYDFCAETGFTVGGASAEADADPLETDLSSYAFVSNAGRCLLSAPAVCTTDSECGKGAFCEDDTCNNWCDSEVVPGPKCHLDHNVSCTTDADCPGDCSLHGGACSSDGDCFRCVLRQPGTCVRDSNCPTGSTCSGQAVVAAARSEDFDGDAVPDYLDNCPKKANKDQSDRDEDGAGDVCDKGTQQARKCQEAIAKASRGYFTRRLIALQKCRDKFNKGSPQYLDEGKTIALPGPAECVDEFKTQQKMAKEGTKMRLKIAKPGKEKCTDEMLKELGACADTVDGLVNTTGDGGCLITTHAEAVDALLADEYGGTVPSDAVERRKCQQAIAKAGRKYAVGRLKALQKCFAKTDRAKDLFEDKEKTLPVAGLAECGLEYRAAKKIRKLGETARKLIAKPGKEKCTTKLLQDLGSTCAGASETVDNLISPTGDGGCLIDGHKVQVEALLEAVY